MATGTKQAGITCDVYFNSKKIAARLDLKAIGQSHNVIDAGDADGASAMIGQPKLDSVTVNTNYLDTDTDQQATIALEGNTNSGAGYTLEARPAGTGTGKTKISCSAALAGWGFGAPINGAQTIDLTFAPLTTWQWGTQT